MPGEEYLGRALRSQVLSHYDLGIQESSLNRVMSVSIDHDRCLSCASMILVRTRTKTEDARRVRSDPGLVGKVGSGESGRFT
jgi:hypothetical protein